jgi:hypothetical protein
MWWLRAGHPILAQIRGLLEVHYATAFERVNAAYYRDGRDSVAWHGDTTARDLPEAVVATISRGSGSGDDIALPGAVPGAGPIDRSGSLRDDPFEPMPTRVLEEPTAVSQATIDAAKRRRRPCAEESSKMSLTFLDGVRGQVFAVEMQQIEDEIANRRTLVHGVEAV